MFLEKCIYSIKDDARTLVRTDKAKALILLKKAKMKEKQLLSINGQKDNMETQICSLEQGISNQNIIKSMRQYKITIDKINKKLDPDEIGDLMDNINDVIDNTDEITNTMSSPIGQVYDNDDLLSEFEEYNKESIITSKSVPNKVFVTVEDQELKELKELKELEKLMVI